MRLSFGGSGPSRRQLLGGLAGATVLGGAASRLSLGSLTVHQPTPGTWPLDRYDSANTGKNPDATVPSDPTVAWSATVPSDDYPDHRLVVGPESVYVTGRVTTALDRATGAERWSHEAPTTRLALDDGTLYAYGDEYGDVAKGPLALDPADGTLDWRTEGGAVYDHLLPAGGTLFVGHGMALAAYDADSGARRWRRHMQGGLGDGGPAIRDGTLYGVGSTLAAFESRTLADAATGSPPPTAWRRDFPNNSPPPVVTRDRILVPRFVSLPHDRPALAAFDPATGERVWSAIRPDTIYGAVGFTERYIHEGYEFPRPPVVLGDQGVIALTVYETGDPPPETYLAGFSVADGSIRWERAVDRGPTDLVATGATVVLSTFTTSAAAGGTVQAFDAETGEERWRQSFADTVRSLAVVGETVFATTDGGRVVALR